MGRFSASAKRTTARSLSGSVLISVALNSRPSASSTVTVSAPSTTWLLVSTIPDPSTITPEPTPERPGGIRCSSPGAGISKPSGMPSRKKSSNGVPLNGFSAFSPRRLPPPPPRFALAARGFDSLLTTTTLGVAAPAAVRKALERAFAWSRADSAEGSSARRTGRAGSSREAATARLAGTDRIAPERDRESKG